MTILYLVAVLALVAAAGFFSSAETAVLAANRMRLRYLAAHANRPASYVLAFLKKPDRFLTSILFGNNVALVAATTLLTVVVQRYTGEAAGVVAAAVAMTALLTLFSEVIPKSVVLEDPDFFAMAFARPVRVWAKVVAPVGWAVRVVAGGLLGVVRVRAERLPFATREELRAILTSRGPRSRAEVVQRRMIRRIFTFGETTAGQVMVPLAEVVSVPETAGREDVVAAVARSGFSKFPVYRESPDDLMGVVIARDFITAPAEARVCDYAWAPVYVSAEASVEELLPQLQTRRVDLAVVRDDRGRALGILTQEDIVEEVVGEIEDEYDWGVHGLLAHAGGYTADARVAISYFNDRMPASLPPGDYVTLGGFLASRLGRVPHSGDVLEWPPYRFRILRATPRAARLVAVEVRRAENG